MRNPTPFILSLLLALLAIILIVTGKESPSAEPAPAQVETPAETPLEITEPPAPQTVTQPTPWPFENSDITPDPDAVFGSLPNGFRYIILPNEEPPNRLSIRLHVAAGSLQEEENQRGLAHFLEHMVFNGSKNYKDANAMIREMQSRGIAFGAHVNAYTSFDETVYMFDLPNVKPDTLDLAFGIMRDFGDGALLSPEEIEAERGVILAEKASRDSVQYRMMEQQFTALIPDSLIAQRFPIGIESVIQEAQRDRFVDFYENHYIPSKMTFVVVGHVDPGPMQKRIAETFGSMENPETQKPSPELGSVSPPEGLKTHIFSDPELDSSDVSINLVRPYEKLPDTSENRSARIPLKIAHAILTRRLERLAKSENSPISGGSAAQYTLFNELELGTISVTVAEDRWADSTRILEQEFRRALEFPFTTRELNEAKANFLNTFQEAVNRKDTRKSETLASAIAGSVNDGTVFSTPETNLEIVSQALAELTVEDTHQAFKSFWNAPGYHLVLSTKTAPENARTILSETYTASSKGLIEAPEDGEATPFGYTDFGPAGSVALTTEVEDLDVHQITLSNNIRINLKQTPFEKNRIRFLARIGTGQLSQPDNTPMLDKFATAVFNAGGLGKHSNDDLFEILAGKNVASTLSVSEDALLLSGSTTPEDQLLQLQLMTAMISDPGYRPEALWQFRKNIPVLFQNLKHTTAGPMAELQAWLHQNDFRYSVPKQEDLSNYSLDQVKTWLDPQLANGAMELSIVGDFNREELLADILSTLGTLPERALEPTGETPQNRKITLPQPPAEKQFTYDSKIPQAIATAIWKTNGIRDNIPEFRRLNILSEIYGDRLREEVREKLGASYSPNAGASGSDALENFGYLIAQAICKPDDVPRLLETMQTIGSEIAENGASQDELDRALAPTLTSLEKSLRDNNYWLSTVLSGSQNNPERLEYARTRDEDYRSIKLETINDLAAKYYQPSNLLRISTLPNP